METKPTQKSQTGPEKKKTKEKKIPKT